MVEGIHESTLNRKSVVCVHFPCPDPPVSNLFWFRTVYAVTLLMECIIREVRPLERCRGGR